MTFTTLLKRDSLVVFDYRCSARPGDAPFAELHDRFSLSYVRKGSFGYQSRGRFAELIAGSILVGHPGDEYVCTHDHVHGDECLSFQFAPDWIEAIGGAPALWRTGAVPPLAELMVLGELAQAAASGGSDIGLDEMGMLLAARFVETVSGQKRKATIARAADRRRAVTAALWIEAHAGDPIDLESAAAIHGACGRRFPLPPGDGRNETRRQQHAQLVETDIAAARRSGLAELAQHHQLGERGDRAGPP